jgi:hypothetical protein
MESLPPQHMKTAQECVEYSDRLRKEYGRANHRRPVTIYLEDPSLSEFEFRNMKFGVAWLRLMLYN